MLRVMINYADLLATIYKQQNDKGKIVGFNKEQISLFVVTVRDLFFIEIECLIEKKSRKRITSCKDSMWIQ